ncbi:MAG: hypothetical protein LBS31_07315 [Candidatus Adiutrix sp.]|jgi:hypothetical protein|nr:hypothetical protein [Candidatus Adiutrix sp.]
MTTKLKLAAGLIGLAAALGGWLYVQALRSDNERLEAAAALAQAEAAGLKQELAAGYAALAARETARLALAAETETLRRQLEEVYDHDDTAKTWSNDPLPDAVYQRLRR